MRGTVGLNGATNAVRVARVYNPPFLQTFAVTTNPAGIQLVDVSRPTAPTLVATVNTSPGAMDLVLEEFPLDRTVDSLGAPLMDVSHEGARWLNQKEFKWVLGLPMFEPPTAEQDDDEPEEEGEHGGMK